MNCLVLALSELSRHALVFVVSAKFSTGRKRKPLREEKEKENLLWRDFFLLKFQESLKIFLQLQSFLSKPKVQLRKVLRVFFFLGVSQKSRLTYTFTMIPTRTHWCANVCDRPWCRKLYETFSTSRQQLKTLWMSVKYCSWLMLDGAALNGIGDPDRRLH